MSYPQPVTQQPMGTASMGINPKNSLNKPIDNDGRDWSYGICGCDHIGTCLLAWCLPCIVYGSNKKRLEHLSQHGTPDPEKGGICSGDCILYGAVAACCGIGCLLQIGTRGNVRQRYGIKGGTCGDCLSSCFCTPCALTQEEQEISLEEVALSQQGYKN
ncbi:hypothetical protein H0H92_008381 [Tricholoma furcatifolium]|nr:hypothetical protein H0H92_008381 [Tricholoma furcatifolium]